MRKMYLLVTVLFISFLAACSSSGSTEEEIEEINSVDVSEFVEVTYKGLNSVGIAEYTVDYEIIFEEIYGDELSLDSVDGEEALEQLKEDLSIYLDDMTDLTNDDEIILSIDSTNDQVKTTEKTLVVSGLEDPKVLTTKDVEGSIDIEFKGINGNGNFEIYNQFDEPLHDFYFPFVEVDDLSNGDEVILEKDEINEDELLRLGYVLDEDFAPRFEVSGLTEMANTVNEINNYNELKEEIDEKMRDIKKAYFIDNSWQKYDYTGNLEKWMYVAEEKKPFEDEEEERLGSLIAVYSMKDYDWNDNSLVSESTYVMGYYNLFLDEDNNVKVEEAEEIDKQHRASSDEVIKLYEEHGYKLVK